MCLVFYNTPPLWCKKQYGVNQFNFPTIDFENFIAKEIPKKLRLGHKMEYVFEQLITHSIKWNLIAKNLLIDNDKQRIGELDFLLKNTENNNIYHVELAYKFYIINTKITDPIHSLIAVSYTHLTLPTTPYV